MCYVLSKKLYRIFPISVCKYALTSVRLSYLRVVSVLMVTLRFLI